MKISKLFHWLYASVMFLPLLIIPIFAIWTINHDNNQSISIDVPLNKVVTFNQLYYQNVDVTSLEGNFHYEIDNQFISGTFTASSYFEFYSTTDLPSEHILYLALNDYYQSTTPKIDRRFTITSNGTTSYYLLGDGVLISLPYGYTKFAFMFDARSDYYSGIYPFDFEGYINIFDLTLMFGEGNEPTINEFKQFYSNNYYDYTLGHEELLKDYQVVTYDNTDVGSQFIYTLYRSCEEYLNFDDVLSLGSISDWIETNVFNGNAPLVYTIVWHYLDYWLILSIFWLCFDVLIYVPQIAHRWLDKASLE